MNRKKKMKRKFYPEHPNLQEYLKVLKTIYEKEYREEQIESLNYGLWAGVDLYQIADPTYDGRQMKVLCEALKKGIDIEILMKPEFSGEQMQEIFLGLLHGVQIEKYAMPDIDAKWMSWLRLALQKEIEIDNHPEFFENCFQAHKKYIEIMKARRKSSGQRKMICVERISKETFYMEVSAEDTIDIEQILERIEGQSFKRAQFLEDALNAEGIFSIERKLLTPSGKRESYFSVVKEIKP